MNEAATTDHKSVLLIGGPDAGKSNFLFRLWIAIDGGGGALVKDGLPAEVEYLRGGAERLLEGEFAEHTPREVYERVVIPVRSSALTVPHSGTLVVPDVSGERVLDIFRDRQWSQAWEELISPSCACLIFVRAGSDEIIAPLDWATCFDKYGTVIDAPQTAGHDEIERSVGDASSTANSTDDEKPGKTPTQVVLTEWLQFLRRAFTDVVGGSFRPRVGVVISAWDAVPIEQQSRPPVAYLKENFPMLNQFIEANADRFNFQVFGVSIVAGDLKSDDEFKQNYLRAPRDFGFVVHSLAGEWKRSCDITLPVAWGLGIWDHEC